MRLATLRTPGGTVAVRIDDSADGAITTEIRGVPDVGALLALSDWRDLAAGATGASAGLDLAALATLVPNPRKVVCVGLNYRNHILEMGRELPEFPTLFAKFPEALIGARDRIEIPPVSSAVDWECELVAVVGTAVRGASRDEARPAIAGYTVMNDVTMRDYQYRTGEWLQGKTFEHTTPVPA
jgi:acylpyruvate hydrolase